MLLLTAKLILHDLGFTNSSARFTSSFLRFAKSCRLFINLFPRFINDVHNIANLENEIVHLAHDLAYYYFPSCHVRGSVEIRVWLWFLKFQTKFINYTIKTDTSMFKKDC